MKLTKESIKKQLIQEFLHWSDLHIFPGRNTSIAPGTLLYSETRDDIGGAIDKRCRLLRQSLADSIQDEDEQKVFLELVDALYQYKTGTAVKGNVFYDKPLSNDETAFPCTWSVFAPLFFMPNELGKLPLFRDFTDDQDLKQYLKKPRVSFQFRQDYQLENTGLYLAVKSNNAEMTAAFLLPEFFDMQLQRETFKKLLSLTKDTETRLVLLRHVRGSLLNWLSVDDDLKNEVVISLDELGALWGEFSDSEKKDFLSHTSFALWTNLLADESDINDNTRTVKTLLGDTYFKFVWDKFDGNFSKITSASVFKSLIAAINPAKQWAVIEQNIKELDRLYGDPVRYNNEWYALLSKLGYRKDGVGELCTTRYFLPKPFALVQNDLINELMKLPLPPSVLLNVLHQIELFATDVTQQENYNQTLKNAARMAVDNIDKSSFFIVRWFNQLMRWLGLKPDSPIHPYMEKLQQVVLAKHYSRNELQTSLHKILPITSDPYAYDEVLETLLNDGISGFWNKLSLTSRQSMVQNAQSFNALMAILDANQQQEFFNALDTDSLEYFKNAKGLVQLLEMTPACPNAFELFFEKIASTQQAFLGDAHVFAELLQTVNIRLKADLIKQLKQLLPGKVNRNLFTSMIESTTSTPAVILDLCEVYALELQDVLALVKDLDDPEMKEKFWSALTPHWKKLLKSYTHATTWMSYFSAMDMDSRTLFLEGILSWDRKQEEAFFKCTQTVKYRIAMAMPEADVESFIKLYFERNDEVGGATRLELVNKFLKEQYAKFLVNPNVLSKTLCRLIEAGQMTISEIQGVLLAASPKDANTIWHRVKSTMIKKYLDKIANRDQWKLIFDHVPLLYRIKFISHVQNLSDQERSSLLSSFYITTDSLIFDVYPKTFQDAAGKPSLAKFVSHVTVDLPKIIRKQVTKNLIPNMRSLVANLQKLSSALIVQSTQIDDLGRASIFETVSGYLGKASPIDNLYQQVMLQFNILKADPLILKGKGKRDDIAAELMSLSAAVNELVNMVHKPVACSASLRKKIETLAKDINALPMLSSINCSHQGIFNALSCYAMNTDDSNLGRVDGFLNDENSIDLNHLLSRFTPQGLLALIEDSYRWDYFKSDLSKNQKKQLAFMDECSFKLFLKKRPDLLANLKNASNLVQKLERQFQEWSKDKFESHVQQFKRDIEGYTEQLRLFIQEKQPMDKRKDLAQQLQTLRKTADDIGLMHENLLASLWSLNSVMKKLGHGQSDFQWSFLMDMHWAYSSVLSFLPEEPKVFKMLTDYLFKNMPSKFWEKLPPQARKALISSSAECRSMISELRDNKCLDELIDAFDDETLKYFLNTASGIRQLFSEVFKPSERERLVNRQSTLLLADSSIYSEILKDKTFVDSMFIELERIKLLPLKGKLLRECLVILPSLEKRDKLVFSKLEKCSESELSAWIHLMKTPLFRLLTDSQRDDLLKQSVKKDWNVAKLAQEALHALQSGQFNFKTDKPKTAEASELRLLEQALNKPVCFPVCFSEDFILKDDTFVDWVLQRATPALSFADVKTAIHQKEAQRYVKDLTAAVNVLSDELNAVMSSQSDSKSTSSATSSGWFPFFDKFQKQQEDVSKKQAVLKSRLDDVTLKIGVIEEKVALMRQHRTELQEATADLEAAIHQFPTDYSKLPAHYKDSQKFTAVQKVLSDLLNDELAQTSSPLPGPK